MRFFYFIVLLFLGSVVSGQPLDSTEFGNEFEYIEEEASFEYIHNLSLPFPDDGFFHDYKYNHFQELFPSELLKESGIKSIIVNPIDKDETPTISVNKENITSYYLNEKGKVRFMTNNHHGREREFHFDWTENLLTEKLIIENNEDGIDSTVYTYEYSKGEIHISTYSNIIWSNEKYRIYSLDEKNRINRFLIFHEESTGVIQQNDEETLEKELVVSYKSETFYDDESNQAIIKSIYSWNTFAESHIDTVFFQKDGKVYLLKSQNNNLDLRWDNREEEVIYSQIGDKDRIIKYINTRKQYVGSVEVTEEVGNLIDLDSMILANFVPNDKRNLITEQTTYNFSYDSKGLIYRILITDKGFTTEYEVTYLKN